MVTMRWQASWLVRDVTVVGWPALAKLYMPATIRTGPERVTFKDIALYCLLRVSEIVKPVDLKCLEVMSASAADNVFAYEEVQIKYVCLFTVMTKCSYREVRTSRQR